MSIQLRQLIIHELEKQQGSGEASLFLTDRPIDPGKRAVQLIEKLHDTFVNKENTLYGYFLPAGEAPFPELFRTLTVRRDQAPAFLEFSHSTMKILKLGMQGITGAKGGYFVYVHYHFLDRPYIGIFLVRDTEGIIFKRDPERKTFELDPVTYLNTDRLAMAALFDLEKYLDQADQPEERGDHYVRMIKHAKSQKEISEYFQTWIGLDRVDSTQDFTQTFIEVIQDLPLPVDEETGEVMGESEFVGEVVDFVTSRPQQTINLRDFDHHFYGEQPITQQYLEDNNIALDSEFRYDRRLINRMFNFRVAADGLELKFTKGHYSTRTVKVEGDLVVIRSRELADKIKALFQHEDS